MGRRQLWLRAKKMFEISRKPFYDGPIDIKRWRMRKKIKQIQSKIRSLFQKKM
jgi:hypothetical protein